MILYGFWRSSATWRARLMLGLKGLAYEYRAVNLIENGGEQNRPDYVERNPMRQVPLLEVHEEDGSLVRIGQSLVIAEYLEERFPLPRLLPLGRAERARVRQVAETVNSGIQPLANTAVRIYVHDVLGSDDAAWCRHWVGRGLTAVEAMVQSNAGPFAFGDAPTLADVCIVPQLFHARRFGVDTNAFEALSRIEKACYELDVFARAHAELQPDAPRAAP
ncbi:maleylacetoacetate isomerase [Pendulispora rubella]|uniref:Maleylacetoacetate isomerase n=1 Tax=Pendulispora rubella TaxID=2741070 RepID=A0ABZ2L218_9BACT